MRESGGLPGQPGISPPAVIKHFISAHFSSNNSSWKAPGRAVLALSQALVLTTGPRAAPGCRKHPGGAESYTLGGHSPEPKHDLVVAKVSVVIDGQDGLRLDLIPRQEAVVQAVLLRAYDLRDKQRASQCANGKGLTCPGTPTGTL